MPTFQNHPSAAAQPLVSFVIPCYDLPGQLLHECLDSIRALTLRPAEREIIIVDDGSPVSLLSHLQDYADELIYLRKPNGGVSTARNAGLLMATGKYVQFLDGDDCLERTAYEHVLDLVRYGQPGVVMFDFSSGETATEGVYTDDPSLSGRELLRLHNIHGSACGYVFQRALLAELRFTPGIAYGEDEEFTPQLLLRADSVVRTSAPAYYYRQRSTSAIHDTSVRGTLRRLGDAYTVIMRLHHLADTMPTEERLALQRRVHQLTMDYIYNIILLTRNRHYLDRRIGALSREGLYPLPAKNYTTKYQWFRRLANSPAGLSMLMTTIPLMKREA